MARRAKVEVVDGDAADKQLPPGVTAEFYSETLDAIIERMKAVHHVTERAAINALASDVIMLAKLLKQNP